MTVEDIFQEIMEGSIFDNERDSYYMTNNDNGYVKLSIVSNKFKGLSREEREVLCLGIILPILEHPRFKELKVTVQYHDKAEYRKFNEILKTIVIEHLQK